MLMFVNSRCRKCGSTVPFDDTRELMYCCYCGAQLFRTDIIAGSPAPVPAPAAPKQANAVSGPNLVVSYQSKYPDEPMILIIVETKESVSVYPGQQVSLHINAGKQKLFFKMHNKTYIKPLSVDPNANGPIMIDCSLGGVAHINIQYPSAVVPTVTN